MAASTRGLGALYLLCLALLAVGFYILVIVALMGMLAWVAGLCYLTAMMVRESFAAIRLVPLMIGLIVAVLAACVGIVRSLFVRVGGRPSGIQATPARFPALFALSREVAGRVDARPLDEIVVTPYDTTGVREEGALYLPPGMGRRCMVLGMPLLCNLTVEQLRAVLAHEYAHFSNHDTYLSRFVYRISETYDGIVHELARTRHHQLNPFYWLFRLHAWLYEVASASFSRQQELEADRLAAQVTDRRLFGETLVKVALEGAFFDSVGPDIVKMLVRERMHQANLYHTLGLLRREHDIKNPGEARKVLGRIFNSGDSVRASHPTLHQRLRALGMPTALAQVAPLPRMATAAHVSPEVDQAVRDAAYNGPPSAAEELFGEALPALQVELTSIAIGDYARFVSAVRRARAAALDAS